MGEGSQTFSVETVNISGFAGHMVSITTIQLCCWREKAASAILNEYGTERLWLTSNKTLLTKPGGGLDLVCTSTVLTLALYHWSLMPLLPGLSEVNSRRYTILPVNISV